MRVFAPINGDGLEEKNRRKLLIGIGSLVVAVMFVSGIAAFGDNNISQASSTTIAATPKTYFVTGTTNVVVSGYYGNASLSYGGANSTTVAALNGTLGKLEGNGWISDYYATQKGFQVLFTNVSNFGPYALQQDIYSNFSALNSSIVVNATATVLLPPVMNLYYNGQQVTVYPSRLNYTAALAPPAFQGTSITLSVQALITTNGSIYQNQISLKPE